MLHAHAMARVGEANPGHGCRKTPEFGLVEDGETLQEACTNNRLHMSMPHVAPPPRRTFHPVFYKMARDGNGGEKGGSGQRTGNLSHRSPNNAFRRPRRPHWSPPLVAISKAHARKQEAKLALWLMSARVGQSISARWL